MRIHLLAFVTGTASLALWPELPAPTWLWLSVLLPALWTQPCLRVPTAFAAGVAWGLLHASLAVQSSLPHALEGRDLLVEGYVVSVPLHTTRGVRFVFRIERILQPAGLAWQGDVRISWYRRVQPLRAGERWRLRVRLRAPHGFRNPGGFDLEAWMLRQGLRASGYVRRNMATQLPGRRWNIHVLRQSMREKIRRWTAGHAHAGLLMALTIGLRDGIMPDRWETLRLTGTSHLVAISGLHIGIVAGLVFMLWRWLWRRWQWLTNRCAAPRAAALAAMSSAFVYAAMAGFSIPTVRALIMLCVVMLALWRQRVILPSRVLVLALFAVVLTDPFATMAPGFWLSFTAVAVILFTVTGRIGRRSRWREAWRIQWVVALGLAPLGLFLFGQASLVSPLANLLAVPWISLLVVPLVLAGGLVGQLSDTVGMWLFGVADLLMQPLWAWLETLARLPQASWQAPAPSLPVLAVAGLGVVLLLAPRGFPARSAGLVLLLPILLPRHNVPAPGGYRMDVLDVGQGLAVVVQTARHVLLYDTGPAFGARFDVGRTVIVPFLRQRGIGRIDRLVVSHADRDHRGGLGSIMRMMPVGDVVSGMPAALPVPARPCRAGQTWVWDGVRFSFLHPDAGRRYRRNDRSCVLRVSSAGGGSVLLSGDIGRHVENRLIQAGMPLRADILLVPHHGSRTSSSARFIDTVQPRLAIVTTGYQNRFGHPKPDIRQRYLARGIIWLDTMDSGAITVTVPPYTGAILVRRFRIEHAAWWHHRMPNGVGSSYTGE